MKIIGKTFRQFLPVFYRFYQPGHNFSNTNFITIYNIFDSYVKLSLKKNAKISVKDLINKAGYSRTTFYSYFTDTLEVRNTLEEIISYHMYLNSELYCNCFLGHLSEATEHEMLSTIEDFAPYIQALMIRSPEYEQHYSRDFGAALSKTSLLEIMPMEIRPYLVTALSAAMVTLIKKYLFDDNSFSLHQMLRCTQLLIQSLLNLQMTDTEALLQNLAERSIAEITEQNLAEQIIAEGKDAPK